MLKIQKVVRLKPHQPDPTAAPVVVSINGYKVMIEQNEQNWQCFVLRWSILVGPGTYYAYLHITIVKLQTVMLSLYVI